jgi:aminoglycoside phosphotransferase (APT) family kinase protein
MSERATRLKMHADEVHIDTPLVRRLISAQCQQWASLPLERMPSSGTDNAIYRLGDDMGVRLPRIHWAVQQIGKECEWLEQLAPQLPTPVPVPLAKGEPGDGYPYPWLVYHWLEGEDLQTRPVVDVRQLARDVAGFVLALERVDPANGPPVQRRGGRLESYDETTRRAIRRLGAVIDVDRATGIWEAALNVPAWTGPPVWVHGDLLPGNVLVRDGRLAGIIDWSGAGVGDPACEAMLAWSLPPDARADFRTVLGFDDATWARARGWVVEQAVHFILYYADTIPDAVAAATFRLHAVVAEGPA